jgi:predicted nucleic acid-binding protein
MSAKAFFDTNVLIYALGQSDPRTATAEQLLSAGGCISVQVLNEFASVARRKLNLAWHEVVSALEAIRELCNDVVAIDVALHEDALGLAQRYNLSIYDALIVAAARAARCEVLYSEDMQHGQSFDDGLRIENPFRP